ncbi:proline-rich receptor-like protein kinase PERK2 isoform X2 [Hevea brasiliensis]|uniref:proline-rich receptor-like protein kinase PERK2 isoform X2 n=1 Tax=Hevea brasiliensis TaxID=3981 RepID=UPI0025EA680C|nr:proline-rich receptor-like protein kinase PERK2 isoform X2 [Hevea brasiliensis]
MNCRLSKNPRLEYITANTGNLYSHHIVTMGKSVATLQLLMGCCKTSSEADGRTDTTDDRPKLPAPLNHQSPVMDPIESSSSYDKENRSHPPASETGLRYEMKKYGFKELAEVTGYFSDDNLLGEGGFGLVYKATLDGEDVAIKKLKRELENKLEESEYLSSVSHPNIVKMIGYCSEGKNRLLVLEFIPNNTLAYHLHVEKNKTLDWSTRMNIALQTANGLLYLHEGCKPSIIHRDMKADNILLDNNFKVKAKNRIGQALNNDDYTRLVDSRLKEYKENEMLRMIYCAAASVYKPSFSRPNMNQIFRILQGTMRPEQIMKRKDIISLLDDMPQDAQMYQMKKYSFIELARATDFFSNDHLLGEGFGQVFRGILDGEVVAIKKVKILNLENYLEEIEQLSILSHPNIVKVIGYCVEKSNRLLVSECVPNGSLEHHLHYARDTILDWSKRMKIATNSAKGLLHLHEGSILKIIHGNIKAANILLDKDFEPKVADIMLAAMLPNFDSFRSLVANVYRDAEDRDRRISDKSDVYSFGVILLELISGRKLLDKQGDIIAWAKNRIGQALNNNVYVDLVDPKLQEYNEDEMKRMICCAAASIYKAARFRPTMKQIVEVLQGSIPWTSIWNNDNNYL